MELKRKKNVATRIVLPLIDAASRPDYFTGTAWGALTNADISAYSWADGEAAASLVISGTPAELGTTGLWELALTKSEMNPDSGDDDYIIIKLSADEIDDTSVLLNLKAEAVEADPLVNYVYARVGIPSDLGDGATLADNFVTIDGKSSDLFTSVNSIYSKIGEPTDIFSGASLSDNLIDINSRVETSILQNTSVETKVDTVISDVFVVDGKVVAVTADVADIDAKIGTPIDLGDGTTLSDNITSIAGKTAGAASYNRATDSNEALADAEADNISVNTMKDLLFNREVTGRHANGKPSVIKAGTGVNETTVSTTLDSDPGMEEFIDKEEIV
jgi:hypothetical protein